MHPIRRHHPITPTRPLQNRPRHRLSIRLHRLDGRLIMRRPRRLAYARHQHLHAGIPRHIHLHAHRARPIRHEHLAGTVRHDQGKPLIGETAHIENERGGVPLQLGQERARHMDRKEGIEADI